jgi:hypothetical protein
MKLVEPNDNPWRDFGVGEMEARQEAIYAAEAAAFSVLLQHTKCRDDADLLFQRLLVEYCSSELHNSSGLARILAAFLNTASRHKYRLVEDTD